MTHNPMFDGGHDALACFMFTGMRPVLLLADGSDTMQRSDIMNYLYRYIINDRDGTSIVINGGENLLGEGFYAQLLAIQWDVIRTDISSQERSMSEEARAFLNALDIFLKIPGFRTLQAVRSAAENLEIPHINPERFVDVLDHHRSFLRQEHRNLLRTAVQEVLGGGPGYIGFPGGHNGNLEGINEAANTFTYSEPNYPTVVHTGELSGLIQAIMSGKVSLTALEPMTKRNDRQPFEHTGTSRGRRLRELHSEVVSDGKIDQAESGLLANLMAMDDGAFRHVYDRDKNSVIEGSELKAVQLRVDRCVDHFELTPIW